MNSWTKESILKNQQTKGYNRGKIRDIIVAIIMSNAAVIWIALSKVFFLTLNIFKFEQ